MGVDGSWSIGGGTFSVVPHSWFLCASPECSDFSCSVIFPVEPCWLLCCLPGQDTVGPDWPQLLTQLSSAARAKVLLGVPLLLSFCMFLSYCGFTWLHFHLFPLSLVAWKPSFTNTQAIGSWNGSVMSTTGHLIKKFKLQLKNLKICINYSHPYPQETGIRLPIGKGKDGVFRIHCSNMKYTLVFWYMDSKMLHLAWDFLNLYLALTCL